MKTRVTFEVLVNKFGNVVKNHSFYDWTIEGLRACGNSIRLETIVVDGGTYEAYSKALEMGARFDRTMKFTEL